MGVQYHLGTDFAILNEQPLSNMVNQRIPPKKPKTIKKIPKSCNTATDI